MLMPFMLYTTARSHIVHWPLWVADRSTLGWPCRESAIPASPHDALASLLMPTTCKQL